MLYEPVPTLAPLGNWYVNLDGGLDKCDLTRIIMGTNGMPQRRLGWRTSWEVTKSKLLLTNCKHYAVVLIAAYADQFTAANDCVEAYMQNWPLAPVKYSNTAIKRVAKATSTHRVRSVPLQSRWAARSGQYSKPCPRSRWRNHG